MELGNILRSNYGNKIVKILREKGPHKPEFADDVFRKHPAMIYMDPIEYVIVGDPKTSLLCCFFFKAEGWRYYDY